MIKEVVYHPVRNARAGNVKFIIRIRGEIRRHGVRGADWSQRISADNRGGLRMRYQTVRLAVVKLQGIAVVELVENIPEIHILRDFRNQVFKMTQKEADVLPFPELPFFLEPLRMRKMVQRQTKFDSALFEFLEHCEIMIESLLVVPSFCGLYAGPLDRHAEHPVLEFAQHGEILFPEIPEIARLPRRLRTVSFDFIVPA